MKNEPGRYYMAAISDYLRGSGGNGATNAIFANPIARACSSNNFAVNPAFLGS